MRVHSDTGPFNCDQCDYTATSRPEFLTHKNMHNVQSFQCSECLYVTSRRDYLTVHMRRHTGT